MQKLSSLILLLFLFTTPVLSEERVPEILGPQSAYRGNLVVFETSEPADWCLAPLDKSLGKWSVDTSGRILYFASPDSGIYTVCAAIVVDGQPRILSKTFSNGVEDELEPQPDPDDLGAWMRTKTVELSRTKNYTAEKEMFAACFQSIADGIQQGSVRSAPAARAGLRTCLAPKLLACSAESKKLWTQFLDSLADEIEKRCMAEPNNLQRMKNVYGEVRRQLTDGRIDGR
ncbi:MAG: hypothetical protein FWC43_02620 [Planctomycetaceae bacterium]|nr:hypothetical protein [Planctomycetaceae bacterium]